MKLTRAFTFVLCAALAIPSFADGHRTENEADAYDVMIDFILRPLGMAATVAGAGVFVGVSPLTALASIPEPHDAFEKLAHTIVCKPAKWTFVRPVGDYRYDEGCERARVRTVVYQPEPVIKIPEPTPEPMPPVEFKPIDEKLDTIFEKQMMK